MKMTVEQEAAYKLLYAACKKRLTQVSLSSPNDLHYILYMLNGLRTRGEEGQSVPALAAHQDIAA